MPIQPPPASAEVLGQGVKYPPTIDAKGRLALSWGETSVDDSIKSICLTQPNERAMQPDYGAATETFELIDLPRFQAILEQNIADHEPRVSEVSVTVEPVGATSWATVKYTITNRAGERTLTFPLFVGPSR